MDFSDNSGRKPVDLVDITTEPGEHEVSNPSGEQLQSRPTTLRPGGITAEVRRDPDREEKFIVRVRLDAEYAAPLAQTIEQARRIVLPFVAGAHQVVQDMNRIFLPVRASVAAAVQAHQEQIRAVATLVQAHVQYVRSVAEQIALSQQAVMSALSPAWLRVSAALREATSVATRLQLDSRFLEFLSSWQKRQQARTNAPFPWGDLYAVEDALMDGDGRRLLDFTRDVLALKSADVGYVYESLLEDRWEASPNPIPYLRQSVRRRRARAEDEGSRDWLLLESGLVVESDEEPVSPLVNAEAPQGLDPALRVDLVRAGQELELSPDALALHITLAQGGTEGEMLFVEGWDRRRLERAKKQRQRALAKVRTRWMN